MKWKVVWTGSVEKNLGGLPWFILEKFRSWVDAIERDGLVSVRELRGLRDKPLQGNRKGQRSVRLNRAYRVIYVERWDGDIGLVLVIQVNKHGY